MRVVFLTYWGTIGDRILEWMIENTDDEIVAVVTRPGSSGETIKDIVFENYLPLYQPPGNVNVPGFLNELRRLEPDLFVSMYFGRLFSPEMLAIPTAGCINMHPSLLPKYRGQGPSTWPIVNGDSETGQTIHWLDEGIDSGDIIAQRAIPIDPEDTGTTLSEKLTELGIELFTETWPMISAGEAPRIPQDDDEATYSVAPRKTHRRIPWEEPAERIHNRVRAFTHPRRGAWTELGGETLCVWDAVATDRGPEASEAVPGQILAVLGDGVVVQAGEGRVLIREGSVGREGPDMVSFLGGLSGRVDLILE
jgi:methionyl-tRNA formyltransferase